MTMTVSINLDKIPFVSNTLIANYGLLSLDGQDASLSLGSISINAGAGILALSGQDAGFASGSSIVADQGLFALAGQDVTFTQSIVMPADQGGISILGQSAGLITGSGIFAGNGVFTISGQDAGLLSGVGLSASSGSLSLTGQDATLNQTDSLSISADQGSVSLTGQDATLNQSVILFTDSGSFTLSGQDVTFTQTESISIVADQGAFTLSGQDVAFAQTESLSLAADQGSFALAGQDATLTESGGGVVWDISGGAYSQAYAPTQANNPADVIFSSDGTKMILLNNGNDRMYEYDLSTAWDVTTATYTNNLFNVNPQENNPRGLSSNADGTIFYVCGLGDDAIFQYNLSTGFDLSTMSYASKTLDISSNTSVCLGGTISADGNYFYTVQNGSGIRKYDLSTAWDISTGSYDSSFSTSSQTSAPYGVRISSDGTQMLVNSNLGVFQYTLSTAWDITTASYDSVTLSTSSQETGMTGMFISSDATKLYTVGTQNDDVYEYDL